MSPARVPLMSNTPTGSCIYIFRYLAPTTSNDFTYNLQEIHQDQIIRCCDIEHNSGRTSVLSLVWTWFIRSWEPSEFEGVSTSLSSNLKALESCDRNIKFFYHKFEMIYLKCWILFREIRDVFRLFRSDSKSIFQGFVELWSFEF